MIGLIVKKGLQMFYSHHSSKTEQILIKFFNPNLESFAKYDAFSSHVFDLRAEGVRLIAMEEVRNYGKIVYIKNIFEMAGGRVHTPHPTPLAISYRNHQKSLAYFSHLAPLISFFFTKGHSQKKGGGAWPNGLP